MRADALGEQGRLGRRGGSDGSSDHGIHAVTGERLAALTEEHGCLGRAVKACAERGPQRLHRVLPERADALLAALAEEFHGGRDRHEVVERQRGDFAGPRPGVVQQQ